MGKGEIMHKDIGEKINLLRNSKNMTLKELSKKVDLSTSFLSQAERGLTSITINTLKKIATALEVDMNYFFCPPKSNGPLVRRSYFNEIFRIDESKFIYYNLGSDLVNKKLDPMIVTILPGEKGESLVLSGHPGEEFLYVLEGIFTFIIDNKEHEMFPGDSIHFSSSVPHDWVNHSSKLVKILIVSTPSLI